MKETKEKSKDHRLLNGCTMVDRYKWWLEPSIDIGFWGSSWIYKYLVIQPLVSTTVQILLCLHTFSMPVSYDSTLFNRLNSGSWFFKIIHLSLPLPNSNCLSLTHSLLPPSTPIPAAIQKSMIQGRQSLLHYTPTKFNLVCLLCFGSRLMLISVLVQDHSLHIPRDSQKEP